jgi:hypothetical protein
VCRQTFFSKLVCHKLKKVENHCSKCFDSESGDRNKSSVVILIVGEGGMSNGFFHFLLQSKGKKAKKNNPKK